MEKKSNDAQQDTNDDFDSLVDECAKDLDKKVNIKDQETQQNTQQNQQDQPKQPDINSIFKDLGLGADLDFSKLPMEDNDMENAQKMFEEMMNDMNVMQGQNPNMENPFLLACNQMFKDFEEVSKQEQQPKAPQQNPSGQPAGGMPGMSGMPGGFPDMNDPTFMNMLNGLAKDLLGGEGDQSNAAMEKLMGEFTNFLQESEGSEEMKSALESVVQEIINKDTLYEPMKTLKDEFPTWLENNWEKLQPEEHERYNKQLEKIEEICKYYEENQNSTDNTKAFELLGQLQELGSPPEELMKKIASSQYGAGPNPFQKQQ